MSRLLIALFCFFISLESGYTKQNENNAIWATEDFPPFYILHGKLENQGTVDQLITIISQHIPEYNHSRKLMPILRIVDELQAESQIVCASFLYDPDIAHYSIYSDPIFAVPPQQLILRRESWEEMGKPEKISLVKFVASEKFNIGLSKGRNYGKEISKILSSTDQNNDILYLRAGDHFLGLAEMLKQGRLDATIGYNGEARFFLKKSNNANTLVSIPIIENSEPLKVYAVMPKTGWGLKFRDSFNRALSNAKKDPAFRQAVIDWFEKPPSFVKALDELLKGG